MRIPSEIPCDEKTIAKANEKLDKLALDEGARQKVNQPELAACVPEAGRQQSEGVGEGGVRDPLNVDSAPVLFVNGEKMEGVVPVETLYQVIDSALIAAGQTPPPAPPKPAAPAAQPAATPTKPGS